MTRTLSEEEKSELKQYSEGNNYLYEALCSCWENGIRTHACCAGHQTKNNTTTPYIAILIDNNSLPSIRNIISTLQDMSDINMYSGIRKSEDIIRPNNECRSLAIYGQGSNRCELFYKIKQGIETSENLKLTSNKAMRFYNNVEKLNTMPYDEILDDTNEGIVVGSVFTNASQTLIEYNTSKTSKFMQGIRILLSKVFPNMLKNNTELYSKYKQMQDYYGPSLKKKLSVETSISEVKLETNETQKQERTNKNKDDGQLEL